MELKEFFGQYPQVALAFSGGVDSAYLLYAGLRWAKDMGVYYVKSPFQPEFELNDARRLAEELGAKMRVLELDVLCDGMISSNPPNRCYYCKKRIMSAICAAAKADGYDVIIDGTNASDDINDRPGFRALEEQGVLSPLRICGLTKAEVRRLSREAGLFTWDKPAYACLATRIPTGEVITAEKLRAVEQAEEALFAMGFKDFRVRMRKNSALLQFLPEQQTMAAERFEEIKTKLSALFDSIETDPAGREKSQ